MLEYGSKECASGLRIVVGQNTAVRFLKKHALEGRTSHAYLFCGPDGTGKSVAAVEFARLLHCDHVRLREADDACGECPPCRRITAGSHPDVLLIEPDGDTLKIDQVRRAIHRVHLTSVEGRKKVIIILHAECLTADAANSLLKVLEEPPGDTVFVLTCTDAGSTLPTIVSRCQVVPFFSSPSADVTNYRDIAAFVARDLPTADITLVEEKEDVEGLVLQLAALFRDVAAFASGGEGCLLSREAVDEVASIASAWGWERVVTALDVTLKAERALRQRAGRRLVAEWLLMRLQGLCRDLHPYSPSSCKAEQR